jgi:hypothetical protein
MVVPILPVENVQKCRTGPYVVVAPSAPRAGRVAELYHMAGPEPTGR